MARILVIETDARQASLVKTIVLNHIGAQLQIVRSKDQAIAAIDADAPDLILLSALTSPRDEQEIVAHLRTLDRADHLQTLTIPRIASSSDDDGSDGGLLRKFKRRRGAKPRAAGCEPKVFAEEILGYLERAEQIKADRAAVAEAKRLAVEAEAERLSAASGIQESPAPAAVPVYVAPAAATMELPAVAEPAPEIEAILPAVVEGPPVAVTTPEPVVVEAPTPEVETAAPVVVDASPFTETILEPPVAGTLTPEIEVIAPAVVDTPFIAEAIPEPLALSAPTEVQPVAALDHEPVAPDAPDAKSAVEASPVVDTPVVEAPIEPPPAPPHAPALSRTAPLALWPRPDYTPISALAWSDQTPVAEDLRALLRGLRLPTSLADLAGAGGCRIHRVRVAQLPGPATISDRQGDADDLTLESHTAWLDGRRGTPVASLPPRTPSGSR